MTEKSKIDAVDLTSKAISTFCHDLISPISSIITGLELLDEENEFVAREQFLKMINVSAQTASTKLQFIRLAFGATNSIELNCELNAIKILAANYLKEEKFELNWNIPEIHAPKESVKILFNMLLLAIRCNSTNGAITVSLKETNKLPLFYVIATSSKPSIPPEISEIFSRENTKLTDTSQVQPYLCRQFAAANNINLKIEEIKNSISISMVPD